MLFHDIKYTRLIDTNFGSHAQSIPQRTVGMKVFQYSGLSYTDSGLSCDTFNILHISEAEKLEFETLKAARDYFVNNNRDFCLWVNEENLNPRIARWLNKLGLSRQGQEVGMALDLNRYEIQSKPGHARIQKVTDSALLNDYASVISRHWNPPDENVLTYYERTSGNYLKCLDKVCLLVYYLDEEAVATAELFSSHTNVVGLYGFATLESFRGQGIGSDLFSYALKLAKNDGFKTAILQATEDGISIYKKYGFKPITMFYEYSLK